MKKLIALLLALVMVVGLVACGKTADDLVADIAPEAATEAAKQEAEAPAETEAATSGDDTMKLMWYQASGIDTMFESPWFDIQNLGPWMVFESLVAQESDGQTITGVLASDWTISDDGLTYTFTLRDGVTWHDGQPLTTYDVAWSLSAGAVSPTSQIPKTILAAVEGAAEAVEEVGADPAATAPILSGITYDDTTVTLKIAAPDKMFLTMLAACKILPAHVYEEIPLAEMKTIETYVGSGPYKLDEVHFPDYYTVVPYEGYWGNQPGISKVLFTSYEAGGNDAAVNAMITDGLDYVYGMAMSDITVAENIVAQNPNTSYDIQSSTYNRKLIFNLYERGDGTTKTDLQKQEVRQAFNLLLDKDAMAGVYAGQAEPLTTFVPSGDALYNSDIPVFERNVAKAKELLDAAGFDYSQVYEICTAYTDQATSDLLTFMKQNFAEAGVQIEFYLLDGGAWAARNAEKNWDIFYGSNGAKTNAIQQYETVCTFFSQQWGMDEERAEVFDPQYKAWLAAQNESEARQYSDALQVAMAENCYQIPIYAMNTIVTYNNRVQLPEGLTNYDNLTIRNWHWDEWALN